MYYFPNNLRALRGTLSHQALSRASKLGVGRIRLLEEEGLPTRIAPRSLEEIAKRLGVPLTQVFPSEGGEPSDPKERPDPQSADFVTELILEQTTPQKRESERTPGPRPRKVRLLEPVSHENLWEVPIDAKVASRTTFQDMLTAAEELGGWRSLARHKLVVQGGRKFHQTLVVFREEEGARKFYAEWSDRSYVPDPPAPVVEVVHRQEIAPEIAPQKLVPEGYILEGVSEVLPTPEDGDDDGMLVVSAELSPKLMEFYQELRAQYGRGLQKAILIRGITAMAADFGL